MFRGVVVVVVAVGCGRNSGFDFFLLARIEFGVGASLCLCRFFIIFVFGNEIWTVEILVRLPSVVGS